MMEGHVDDDERDYPGHQQNSHGNRLARSSTCPAAIIVSHNRLHPNGPYGQAKVDRCSRSDTRLRIETNMTKWERALYLDAFRHGLLCARAGVFDRLEAAGM